MSVLLIEPDPIRSAMTTRNETPRSRTLLAWGTRIGGRLRIYTAEEAEGSQEQESPAQGDCNES